MFNSSSQFQRFNFKRKAKIWQLFRATDFESFMYPCFTFCRILGIFPYKINGSTIQISKPRYILSTIIICVFCIYELISIYNMTASKNILLRSIPKVLQLQCFYIFGGFIAVATFILSFPRMRLLQTLLDLSLRLSQDSYRNLCRLIHAKDILGFFYLLVHHVIYFCTMKHTLFQPILTTYIILLVFQVDMLYMNCVCVLKACFKEINDCLLYLRKLIANGEPYHLSGAYIEHRNPFLLMVLNDLRKQHLAVSDAIRMLKTIFSLQLVCTIIMSFLQITFNLYFYLMRIQSGMDSILSHQEKYIYYENTIKAATYHLTKIVLIVWACETSKNQAMEINTTVREVFNSTSDTKIKYELQLFSLQLMHCENIFSAKGFNVDAKLLTAMAGSITTYLLILIQFVVISYSCGGKSVNFTSVM